jgi:hypothetical protein
MIYTDPYLILPLIIQTPPRMYMDSLGMIPCMKLMTEVANQKNIPGFMLSQWLIINVNSVLRLLHCDVCAMLPIF